MSSPPPHVATADEPIPDVGDRLWDGPDMRTVMPLEAMLAELAHVADDVVRYVELWRSFIAATGGSVLLDYDRSGDLHLMLGGPCDRQVRHRSRWQHFLCEHLDLDPERRAHLIQVLLSEGLYSDSRPKHPRGTTKAVRDFIATGGRILLDPRGRLMDGGDVLRPLLFGTPDEAAECRRAIGAYFAALRRWRSEPQIKRAVRMLGYVTDNGWHVLEARL